MDYPNEYYEPRVPTGPQGQRLGGYQKDSKEPRDFWNPPPRIDLHLPRPYIPRRLPAIPIGPKAGLLEPIHYQQEANKENVEGNMPGSSTGRIPAGQNKRKRKVSSSSTASPSQADNFEVPDVYVMMRGNPNEDPTRFHRNWDPSASGNPTDAIERPGRQFLPYFNKGVKPVYIRPRFTPSPFYGLRRSTPPPPGFHHPWNVWKN